MGSAYIGRFAPSPTGPLHFGSLLAATASYLDAKAHAGQWHLRIDDIDTTRVVVDADKRIIQSLKAHGLHWHGDIVYQSQQYPAYQLALEQLRRQKQIYHCDCSRKRTQGRPYDGYCRHRQASVQTPHAIRFIANQNNNGFTDIWHGLQHSQLLDDAILWRKDGLCAYQLAVVIDDYQLGVNHIIRGRDLLETTHTQTALYQALNIPIPQYGHFPVLIQSDGRKLSKQNHATAICDDTPTENLRKIIGALAQPKPPETLNTPDAILQFAAQHWQRSSVPKHNMLWS